MRDRLLRLKELLEPDGIECGAWCTRLSAQRRATRAEDGKLSVASGNI